MGFNLGLAAAAYQGVKAEERRLRDDAFTKAQQDYNTARMDEYASRRDQRDNAASLADEEVTAQRGLLDKRTAATSAQLEGELQAAPLQARARVGALNAQLADQGFAESQRGTREQTARLTNDAGLTSAQVGYDDAQDYAKWSPERRKIHAQELEDKFANGILNRNETRDKVLGTIYGSGQAGKTAEHDIVGRLNSISETSLFPELKGKTVAHVKVNGDNMDVLDAGGGTIASYPLATMKASYEKHNPGKVITMADGANAYKQNADGTFTKLTDNKKSFNPNSGGLVGRAGGASALQDRIAKSLMDEAATGGKPITQAEAYRRAAQTQKVNPAAWAQRALQNDLSYTMETDPTKRRQMEDEALGTAQRMAGTASGSRPSSPGLRDASPKTRSLVEDALK